MNILEKKLKAHILTQVGDLKKYTPSLQIEVYKKGIKNIHLEMGDSYKYYDLASLTKIIFTVSAFIKAVDTKKIDIHKSVSVYLPWWPHHKIKIKDVLSHSAHLPWWAPYYKTIKKYPLGAKRSQLQKILAQTELAKSNRSVYSDVDFILLGFVLEAVYQKPLHDIWLNLKWRKYTPSLHFNINNKPKYKKLLYAPTESCPWRKKILKGEVHDDNTWSFGGVSSHSGLFGAIKDVSTYGLLLRQAFKKRRGSLMGRHNTVKKFSMRAVPEQKGDWALGFMLPTKGKASCGKHFSLNSFGHTGFTGTSLWYDPKKDVLITILSNRVHPTRNNKKFVALRPKLHDIIMELI